MTTDGSNDGQTDVLKQAVSDLADVAPGVKIIAIGNSMSLQGDPTRLAKFKSDLNIIANGDADNVVIGQDSLQLAVSLIEKMRNVGAICDSQGNELISH